MLGEIEQEEQNGLITNNDVFPLTNLFFWKFNFEYKNLLMYQLSKYTYSHFS